MKTRMKSVAACTMLVVLFGLLLPTETVAGDEPGVEWEKTFGDIADDRGYNVQRTTDGGYIISGWTYSSGAGDSDVYLIKTDSSGNKEWETTFGGPKFEGGQHVRQTADDGYIIIGVTNSIGAGSGDVYLIRTNSNGVSLWEKSFGGSANDYGHSVQQTPDGGYIITGGTRSFGGGSDAFLIKTDSDGNPVWDPVFKTYGGAGDDYGWSLDLTDDGGYIIAGGTKSFGAGSDDLYLVKAGSSGSFQWEAIFGGGSYDVGGWVQQTADSGYVITGWTRSFGAGSEDLYLIKTDSSGNAQWEKTFGGSDVETGNCVEQTSDGGYVIVGTTSSSGAGSYDVYLIKLAPVGVLVENLVDLVKIVNDESGITNSSLEAKLNPALNTLDDINDNNNVAAINTLGNFIKAVEGQRDKGDISVDDAQDLIDAAQYIIDLLTNG